MSHDPASSTTDNNIPQSTTTPTTSASYTTNGNGVLGSYSVNTNGISVSGLSSGADMATQLHISNSDVFMGIGSIAGAPYYCAENSLTLASTACLYAPNKIDLITIEDEVSSYQTTGGINSLSNLSNDKVFLYSGTLDLVVYTGVVQKTEAFYNDFVSSSNIATEYSVASANGFPTMNNGGPCGVVNTKHINNCGYDAAYMILNHVYGGTNDLVKPDYSNLPTPSGNLLKFDQTEFGSSLSGMNSEGYLFVPESCSSGSTVCRLHVALHGCNQNIDDVGDVFVTQAGYNDVAALNDVIILYPQTKANALNNPQGCWDWWGYTGDDYAQMSAAQIQTIMEMINRLTNQNK